jgi:hypothetical protein
VLDFNDSLFPVIVITGNSGSLLAVLRLNENDSHLRRRRPGPPLSKTAKARFHTINLAQNKNGLCSTWNHLANPPPCFLKSKGP